MRSALLIAGSPATARPGARVVLRHYGAGADGGDRQGRRRDVPEGARLGGVSRATVVIDHGKALYNGRALAKWVDDVVARVFERSEATQVVVFGSVQRGDDGPDSDIDLLVVLPHVARPHDDAVRLLRMLRDLPVPIDLTVIDEASLADRAKEPGLVRVALREGRVHDRAA